MANASRLVDTVSLRDLRPLTNRPAR